ncbi:MAG TPA: GNAT family N-acetyltransferase [Anaerolineae bacterium]|nr:GNAT family N-acetyltransferase [Anaerolineae bacterium]
MDGVRVRVSAAADAPRIIVGINAVCAEGGYFCTPCYVPTPQWEVVLHDPKGAPDYLLLVAEVGGAFIGAARLFPSFSGSCTAELGIFLLPPFRGQGVGAALMRELLRQARVQGYAQIVLSVLSTNEWAIRLYRKFGFTVEGWRRQKYAFLGEQKELIMACSLTEPNSRGAKDVQICR